jgi:hypothetical protein
MRLHSDDIEHGLHPLANACPDWCDYRLDTHRDLHVLDVDRSCDQACATASVRASAALMGAQLTDAAKCLDALTGEGAASARQA